VNVELQCRGEEDQTSMTGTIHAPVVEEMVQRVEPVLRASTATSEAQRHLALEAMEALITPGHVE
jgi:hypothetical protein